MSFFTFAFVFSFLCFPDIIKKDTKTKMFVANKLDIFCNMLFVTRNVKTLKCPNPSFNTICTTLLRLFSGLLLENKLRIWQQGDVLPTCKMRSDQITEPFSLKYPFIKLI